MSGRTFLRHTLQTGNSACAHPAVALPRSDGLCRYAASPWGSAIEEWSVRRCIFWKVCQKAPSLRDRTPGKQSSGLFSVVRTPGKMSVGHFSVRTGRQAPEAGTRSVTEGVDPRRSSGQTEGVVPTRTDDEHHLSPHATGESAPTAPAPPWARSAFSGCRSSTQDGRGR